MTVREAMAIAWSSDLGYNAAAGSREQRERILRHAQRLIADAGRCAMETYLPPPPECKDVKWE
jgi:hypothetical protein